MKTTKNFEVGGLVSSMSVHGIEKQLSMRNQFWLCLAHAVQWRAQHGGAGYAWER